jgi:hypothetical protein
MRPWRPARPSASSLLTRSTTLKNRLRAPWRAGPGDGDGEMGLPGAGATDEHHIALVGEELAAGEIVHQGGVDRGAIEGEVVEVLGQWPPEMVIWHLIERACFLAISAVLSGRLGKVVTAPRNWIKPSLVSASGWRIVPIFWPLLSKALRLAVGSENEGIARCSVRCDAGLWQ